MNHSNINSDTNDSLVHEPVDSIVEVYISNNKLQASIKIESPQYGGMGPNIESLNETIASNNITYGINTEVLLDLCENPRYNENIMFALGTFPVNGIDGRFQIHFDTIKDSKPKEKEDGSVDFYNLENIENVKQEQLLCTIVHPREGKDGISVTGNKIPYVKGKPVASLLGKNTKLSKDGTSINATIDGQVDYTEGKINVLETLYIRDNVDNSTGNIKVVGNVVINGTVLSGFIVEATGNIQIYGGLSSVTLIAGGNILLSGGVIGGNLSCEGDLTSKFIESCKVFTKGNIITDYVMNSNITCRKNLFAINSISKIVGGEYLVSENIQAKTIGSNANVKTYLEIKTDPAIIKRQQELLKKIQALETQEESLISLINLLQQFEASKSLTPEKKETLKKALFSYSEISGLIESNKFKLNKINESIKLKGYGHIICEGKMYPGTIVKIGTAQATIQESMFGKSLYYSEEGIRVGKA